ncbi:hypothetical protein FRC10_002314 [Ceratobasidium sp. 414]|nr:hypothetical protein FRC10_002314 [Ceratobasidium sp. 414]
MSPINQSALSALRANLSSTASVNLPGDANYSVKRWALNAEKPAAAVACPATPEDVAQILAFVQGKAPYEAQQKLDFVIKGGGHTPSGASSSDGGLVIDLQPNINAVRVDPEAKLAYVSGGCLWGDVDEATIKHGLASVSGVVSHTGVAYHSRRVRIMQMIKPPKSLHHPTSSLTLGGGFGWLCSQYGLVIDNIVQYTLVTGSGDILTVSPSSNPDLFWALRGGGSNFGVVTEFVLQLHDQRPDLYSSILVFPPPAIDAVIPEVNTWLKDRTPEENMHIVFANGPSGQPGMVLQMIFNGDSQEGAKRFERFVKLGPVMNMSETIPYIKLNQMQNHLAVHGFNRLLQGNFIPATSDGLPVELVRDFFGGWSKLVTENPAAVKSAFIIELYDTKKWSSVPPDATAYVHRNPVNSFSSIYAYRAILIWIAAKMFNVVYALHWTDSAFTPQAGPAISATDKAFVEARAKYFPPELTSQGGYLNYLDEESRLANKEFVYKRFGDNFKRLVEVKKKYDEESLFGRWFTANA